MMLSGLLIRVGVLSLVPAYISLFAGDLISDGAWYYIGYFFGNRFINRFGKYFDITQENVDGAKRVFFGHKRSILLGSKLTAGFGFSLATLLTAGMIKIPFGEYMFMNFIGQIGWTAILLSIGYFFGNLYITINDVFGRIFVVGIALLISYLLVRLSRYLGRRAMKRSSG